MWEWLRSTRWRLNRGGPDQAGVGSERPRVKAESRCGMAEVIRLFPEPSRLKPPAPPVGMLDPESFDTPSFIPAPELEKWLRATFIEEGGPLQNDDHFHLRFAHIGVRWTSIENSRHGRRVVGQAERGDPRQWGSGRERARNFRSCNGSGASRISS